MRLHLTSAARIVAHGRGAIFIFCTFAHQCASILRRPPSEEEIACKRSSGERRSVCLRPTDQGSSVSGTHDGPERTKRLCRIAPVAEVLYPRPRWCPEGLNGRRCRQWRPKRGCPETMSDELLPPRHRAWEGGDGADPRARRLPSRVSTHKRRAGCPGVQTPQSWGECLQWSHDIKVGFHAASDQRSV